MKLVNIHIPRFVIWFAVAFGAQNAVEAQTMTLQQCVETALLNNEKTCKSAGTTRTSANSNSEKQRRTFCPRQRHRLTTSFSRICPTS